MLVAKRARVLDRVGAASRWRRIRSTAVAVGRNHARRKDIRPLLTGELSVFPVLRLVTGVRGHLTDHLVTDQEVFPHLDLAKLLSFLNL
jgi:hypothetical protein